MNFLKNSHSFSEYSIFTYSFALLYILYIVYFVFRAILFHKCHKIQIFLFFFTTTYHTRFLMDPPQTTGTSVSSGSCFSTLPSGLLPSMTSLEACTSWLLGVTQSPPVDSRPVTGVPLPPQSCVMSSWSVNSSNSLGRPISQQPGSVGNFPSAQPIQAVPVPAGYPVYDQSFHRPPYQPQADFFNSFSSLMSSMLDRVQGIANPAVTQQPMASQDLSQPSGATFNDSQDSFQTQSQVNLEAELQVVDSMPNIPYVQSVNRDYREALDSVFEVLSDKISRPSVQNHDPEDCSDLYPDQSKSSPMSLPISSRLRSSFKMADAYLSDLHSRSSNSGASQTKLRKLGIFPNKPSKLSFARYRPMASDVWTDLLKDPDQGSGLPSPKKEIYLSRSTAHALEKSLRSDLMILNSLDFYREALAVNHTNLVKLVDQTESNLSLDIQQALDVDSLLINQVKFHLIDLLASITHSISTVTLARRDSFLCSVPKHVPDHIVRDLRSHPIYGPSLFGEFALKALSSHTKEYKQEQFQTVLTKGVSKQLSASASRGKSFKRQQSQDRDSQDRKFQKGSTSGSGSFRGSKKPRGGKSSRGRGKKPQPQSQQ